MKRFISVFMVIALCTTVANAQYGGRVELWADTQMIDCSIVDSQPGVVNIHMFHTNISEATALQFAAPTPDCWTGATWVGDAVTALVRIYNTHDVDYGISLGYGACLQLPLYLGFMVFMTTGEGLDCCVYPVIAPIWPDGNILASDCTQPMSNRIYPEGGQIVINPNETCECVRPVPVQETTWGQIKSLYQ